MPLRSVAVLTLSVLLFSACDGGPGLPEPSGRAPLVENLTVTPDVVVRDAIGDAQIDGDTARVPITVSVSATDPDGEIAEVQAVVLSPANSLRPLAVSPLSQAGNRYQATFTLPLPLAQVGLYAVVVVARDEAGQTGQVLGRLAYSQQNDPPVIETVAAAPNPFPAAGGTLVLTARVSDPQGLSDVLRVAVSTPTGDTFRLFDDGESFGDETANDGIFTATLFVPAGATTDDLSFVFRASDRSGLESEPVSLAVTVQ